MTTTHRQLIAKFERKNLRNQRTYLNYVKTINRPKQSRGFNPQLSLQIRF